MSRGGALLVAWALVACADGTRFIPAPPSSGAIRSRVAALIRGERIDQVIALPADRPIVFPGAWADGEEVGLELFEYPAELAALGLDPGPVPPAVSGEPAEPLSPAAGAYTLRARDAAVAAWSPADPRSLALAGFRRATARRCTPLRSERQAVIDAETPAYVALPIDQDSALVVATQRAFRVSSSLEVTPLVVSDPALFTRVGVRDATGRYWFGGRTGELWRGTLTGDTLEVTLEAVSPGGEIFEALDTDPDGNEVYVLTSSGTVLLRRGASFEQVAGWPDPVQSPGSLVWLGPGEIIAAIQLDPRVLALEPGAVRFESLSDTQNGVMVLAEVPELGVVAAQIRGRVHHRLGGVWHDLGPSGLSLDLDAVGATRSGFLLGGALGWVVEYRRGLGFCPPPEQPVLASDALYFLPLGGGLLTGGDKPVGTSAPSLERIDRAGPE